MDDNKDIMNTLPELSSKSRMLIEKQLAKEQAAAKKKAEQEEIRLKKEQEAEEKKQAREMARIEKERIKNQKSHQKNSVSKKGASALPVGPGGRKKTIDSDVLIASKISFNKKSKAPRTAQDSIPYIADYSDGLIEISPNRFSKTIFLNDLNYKDASEDEQFRILNEYGRLLNRFSPDVDFAITINNKIIDEEKKEASLLVKERGDYLDTYRGVYNNALKKMTRNGKGNIQCEKYLTVTIEAASQYEALKKFIKIEDEILRDLKAIKTSGHVMSTSERLSCMHDLFRPGQEGKLSVDFENIKIQGLSSKDCIAPESFEFYKNYFMIGDHYFCSMFLNNLPADISDSFLAELFEEADYPLMFTKSMRSVAQERALKIVKHALTGMQKDKMEQQKKAIKDGYDPEMINNDLKHSLEEAEELLNDLRKKNQKMFLVSFTLIVGGDSKEELEENIKLVQNTAGKFTVQLQKLNFQQEDGLAQTLPLGHNRLPIRRTLTTESTAIFMPFTNQELTHEGGLFYGLNAVSKNYILFDRRKLKNPAGFVLGAIGSGKSFATKEESVGEVLATDDDIIVFDPEREYGELLKALGGEIIQISANSPVRINPLDMTRDYAVSEDNPDADPITLKTEFVQSMFNAMLHTDNSSGSGSSLSPQQKSIVDRCLRICYTDFVKDFDPAKTPTLKELFNVLKEQPEKEAEPLVGALEYYATGSMSVFSEQTNVDVNNRIIVYDTKDLGKSLMSLGMLIIMDTVWNRFTSNRYAGKRTRFKLDEVHLVFKHDLSANLLLEYIKRGRKWGAIITGITQNVSDCLLSPTAKNMFSNSGYIKILNQSSLDLRELAALLNISEGHQEYVTNAGEGQGLLYAEGKIIPFIDIFPADNPLYELMTTKPDEIKAIKERKIKENKLNRRKDAFNM